MTLRITSIEDADKKLSEIKTRDEAIKTIYDFYCKKHPELSKDGICIMMAEKSGLGRSTLWAIITNTNKSVYEKGGIKSL